MKPIQLGVAVALLLFALPRVAEPSYTFADAKERRLTAVGRQVVMGYAATVWHGKRGGVFFAFIDGKKMYLTANKQGAVFVTTNKEEALRWDFDATLPDKSQVGYTVPRSKSGISTRDLGAVVRSLTVLTTETVKDGEGKPMKDAHPVQLIAPPEQTRPSGPAPESVFTIRGIDSRYTVKESE